LNKFVKQLHKIDAIVFKYPIHVLTVVLLVTLFFATQIPAVRMVSDFADLLPQEHPYIQLHNDIRDTFGGANNVIIAVEVKEGTIFTNDTLDRIHRITQDVDLCYPPLTMIWLPVLRIVPQGKSG
jgi:predicted RND superfamily exporter protein